MAEFLLRTIAKEAHVVERGVANAEVTSVTPNGVEAEQAMKGSVSSPFGALLRQRRISARLSQEQLAERARVSVQAVSALERGARQAPRTDTLVLLADALALEAADRAEFEAAARSSAPAKVRVRRSFEDSVAVAPATSFIGRQRELDAIVRALRSARCLTLWGPGGVGKTRLAVEAAALLRTEFERRVAFVSLAPVTDAASVVRAVADAYDLVDDLLANLLDHLVERLHDAKALLVLDNCEHLVEEVSRVAAAAGSRLPQLRIIATSREPLRIAGEAVIPVATLAVPARNAPADAASLDAVRLFLDRAEAASGVAIASENFDSVATICRRLDGLPLAIELAAARTRSMSVASIERALDERFDLLSRGNRDLDERHQTLRGTIAWSYDLLEETQRIVFERVALLGGSFSIEHAVAVASDATIERREVIDAVADLVDKALIAFTSGAEDLDAAGPFALLESTRLFAVSLTPEERSGGDWGDAYRRFGVWLTERAAESYDNFSSDREVAGDAVSIDHLRAYLRWAIDDGGDVATAATIVGNLIYWWLAQGRQEEALRWVATADAKLPNTSVNLRARAVLLLGKAALLRVGTSQAESAEAAYAAHESALGLAQSGDAFDRRILARTALMAAESAAFFRTLEEARALVALSIALCEEIGNANGAALARHKAGAIAFIGGDIERSRMHFAQACSYYERHGLRRFAGLARADYAESEYALGNLSAAVESGRLAASRLLERSSSFYIAVTISNLATYLSDSGAVDEAAEVAAQGLEIARAGGYDRLLACLYLSCTTIALHRAHDARDVATLFAFAVPRLGDRIEYTDALHRKRVEALLREHLSQEEFTAAQSRANALNAEEALALAQRALR